MQKLEEQEYPIEPWKNLTCVNDLIQVAAKNNRELQNTNFPRNKKLKWT